jgi:hypothetical protein
MRYYGSLAYQPDQDRPWVMRGIPPHVAIRLKQIFPRVPKTAVAPFHFDHTDSICTDLSWFMDRYPLEVTDSDRARLNGGKDSFNATQAELERILLQAFVPPPYLGLRDGFAIRPYQAQAIEIAYRSRCLLLGDDLGLGKTYAAAGFCLKPGTLPAAVVVQTHLQGQWEQKITEFTSMRVHKIKGTRPYDLPPADIYIFKYTQLAGWVDVFTTGYFKTAIYDEVQELRTGMVSAKGCGAHRLSENAEFRLGLSATPIFGYGIEVWNIYNCLACDVLGSQGDFYREWVSDGMVKDPDALGTYLREQHVFLRRLKADVGQQMPKVNILHEIIESDGEPLKSIEAIAHDLAVRTVTGTFIERGKASRELDMLVRHATGVGKAPHVAAFARMLLEAGTPIVLAGWHRDVYDIWLRELAPFNPVMYTGTESPKQKEESVQLFCSGASKVLIISLRSGAGLDGLQFHCSTILFGELDWSKKIHEQLIGRLDREGQAEQVMALYLTCEDGSDPPILDVLAIKESQSRGIVDPGKPFEASHSDDSRMKALAQMFLGQREYSRLTSNHATSQPEQAALL